MESNLTNQTSFVKMHGTGNKFVIIDSRLTNNLDWDYKKIAEQNSCDQVIVITNSTLADCFMHVYNADGSKAEMCGNAARCVGYLLMSEKDTEYTTIELINERILECFKVGEKSIKVNMGKPLLKWHEIPLSTECDTCHLPIALEMLKDPVAVNIGNPHMIFFVDSRSLAEPICDEKFLEEAKMSTTEYLDVFEERRQALTTKLPSKIKLCKWSIDEIPLQSLGPILENHELFPQKTNVSIAQIENSGEISLRTWERGIGITASCGSAACATLVASILRGYISNKETSVNLPGGKLLIKWADNVFMTGDIGFL